MRFGQQIGQFSIDLGRWPGPAKVDLHAELKDRMPPLGSVYARGIRVELNGAALRVPADEDHLRMLALHFLRHGGWRPLWLCDIAVLLESISEDFDWELCLGHDARVSQWMSGVIMLAERLLGAPIHHLPRRHLPEDLPGWLVRTVIREWGAPRRYVQGHMPLSHALKKPWILPAQLRLRWPNGLSAGLEINAPFSRAPRLPYQIAALPPRAAHFIARTMFPATPRPEKDFPGSPKVEG